MSQPLLAYTRLAQIYDAIYRDKDYAAESATVYTLIQQHMQGDAVVSPPGLLDIGCGTGGHIEHLREWYAVQGLDNSAAQLTIARERFPDVTFHEASMVDFALDQRFDAVTCLFSSIGYVETVENLRRTIASMAAHLRPGGVLIVEPWLAPEQYRVGHVSGDFVDEPAFKLARMAVAERESGEEVDISVMAMHYLVATPERVEHFSDEHRLALFTHGHFVDAFERVGLRVTHDAEGLIGRGLYLGVAPVE